MSGITYTFDLASSHSAAQSSPAMGAGDTSALEQSYLSASAPREVTASSPVGQEAGPGVTTLAIGEEDGGGMSVAPHTGGMSTPASGGDYQVTTLAIGEEDGGGSSSYAMSPVADDNAMIGGHSVSSTGTVADDYGQMQPIYSPGEAEYPAFVQTSQTTDILNFHPVPRSFTATVQQSMQPSPASNDTVSSMAPIRDDMVQTVAPVSSQPVTSQPVYATSQPAPMEAMPAEATYVPVEIGYAAEPMTVEAPTGPAAGNYESVGSYEDYVAGTSGSMTIAPAETVYAEPLTFEAPSNEPVYEQYQPAADMTAYDNAAPLQAAPVETMPVESAPVDAAPMEAIAPETSAQPTSKPSLIGKDAPLDHSSAEQAADPADGNPAYVAPSDGAIATAPKPEATYITVPLDAYLVEPAGATASEAAPASNATPEMSAPPAAPAAAEGVSMGGSFTVMDQALPASVSGESSGMKTTAPEAANVEAIETAPASTAKDDLSITTMAIGEEDGGGS